ncbi:MAG: class I SAM-dependent RNA methyltransferase [Verrucomicrobia bacterium]|nr:class I SAM-dependent RNA methyltransferase [Verrucomicrobiota bacterium]
MNSDGPEPNGPPPQPGEILVLEVEDLAFGGEGVARHRGCVVFVPFSLPGEQVEAEVVESKKRFARARLLRVLRASPERVPPVCQHYGECGGCQYQHAAYPLQLKAKHRQVVHLLERIGGFERPPVADVIPCPQPYHYRNRLMLRSQWCKPEQRLRVGFLKGSSRLVIDIESCPIAEEALNAQIAEVRAHPPPKGGLKVVIRVMPEDWEVPRDSFFQNNFHLLPALVETVRASVLSGGARHLIDVYCGVGFFGIQLASSVESFLGVELDRPAIKAARNNARRFGAANGEFIEGDAGTLLPDLVRRFPPDSSCVLLDPPRVGCSPSSLNTLIEARPRQILYVSCHPATLARDLRALCDQGYRLEQVTPLDMFPQTQHVECVADLRAGQIQAVASDTLTPSGRCGTDAQRV